MANGELLTANRKIRLFDVAVESGHIIVVKE